MKLKIVRGNKSDKQTIGQLLILDGDKVVWGCPTLELADKGNQKRVSCIPEGAYCVKKRYSTKYKNHLHITDVPNRTYILIHSGNFHTDILGCVLVGMSLKDINKDGYIDVSSSAKAMSTLMHLLEGEDNIELEVVYA